MRGVLYCRTIQASRPTEEEQWTSSRASPDTWLAGPDPNRNDVWQTTGRGEKYVLLVGGRLPGAGIPGSLLSRDSVDLLPALREEHRTFAEVWKDTVFLRTDGDTVHMNSWVVFHTGGFDRDSKYRVSVSALARQLPEFPDQVGFHLVA